MFESGSIFAGRFPHRKRFLSCRLSWMILLTNSSSPPSAMISVTPPVFTELGGGRREFLEFTPWREQQDRQRLTWNPIRSLLLSCKQIVFHVRHALTSQQVQCLWATQWDLTLLIIIFRQDTSEMAYMRKGSETPTFASSWLAKKGGLHMQKSYTNSVSSFKASISKVFWGTLTTMIEMRKRLPG